MPAGTDDGTVGTAVRGDGDARSRQVILVLLDAARADRFSCYGYSRPTTPELDRLAEGGLLFERHYAQGSGTRESIPSLLFSRYFTPPLFPDDPQVPYAHPDELFRRPDAEQVSLPRALQQAGLTTAAISAHLWLGEKTPFAAEFMELDDLSRRLGDERYPYPRARDVVDVAIRWIEQHRTDNYFLYVHLMDTHFPHYFERDAQELLGEPGYTPTRFSESGQPLVSADQLETEDVRYADALYDGSLRYADREIGRLVGFLEREALLSGTTIAITSDHGENLGDGVDGRVRPGAQLFNHGGDWLEPVAHIPLILHGPGVPTGRYDGLTEGVDVAPTLLRLAQVTLPAGKRFDGVDLLQLHSGASPPKAEVSMRQALRTDRHKILFRQRDRELLASDPPDVRALRGELFDLEVDPHESEDLFGRSELVAELLGRYRRRLRPLYERALAARSTEQPSQGFAISSRYAVTDPPAATITEGRPPVGWSRVPQGGHHALVAHGTVEPLQVSIQVPDGRYQLSFGMAGQAAVVVDGRRREVIAQRNMAGFGAIEVRGQELRVTIEPQGRDLLVFFFGFLPDGPATDQEAADERTEKLRALGYL